MRLPNEKYVYHQFPVFCAERDRLQQHLAACGVQTIIHYPIPPHKQTCYAAWNVRSYPITERIHAQELSIPINQVITSAQAEQIVNAINSFE